MPEPVRILLVDDDEDQYVLTRALLADLEGDRYEVDWESDAESGLQAIRRRRHDIYLLDYQLGEEDGLALLRRAIALGVEAPFIMLTGQGGREIDVAAMEAGAADYLTKGNLDPQTLERAIRYALERAKTLAALRESEQRYALAARGANDGLWDWDVERDEVFYSARWKEILGCAGEEVSNRPSEWFDRVHPEDLPGLEQAIDHHVTGVTSHFECEHRLLHADGSFRWILSRGLAVRDAAGRPLRMAGSNTDITERKVHDSLTGLPNRALFLDRVASALTRRKRHPEYLSAVVFLDLDRFKLVNDSLGHTAGDQVLVEVAGRLCSCVRPSDTVARLGGDEFGLLLEDISEPAWATQVAERIGRRLADPFVVEGREIFMTASQGIAFTETGYTRPGPMLRDADVAMYRAKERRGGGYELFDERMRALAVARLQLESDLRRALERDQFRIEYQPIVALPAAGLVGVEALLRWQHPTRGTVQPDDFIPVAEEIGLIGDLLDWVLVTACRETRELRMPGGEPLSLHVNLSPRQLGRAEAAESVEAILRETGFQPERLRLEITESSLVESGDDAEVMLDRLRALGVRFALDDFGKGYSSMAHLSRFQLHTLKIDKSFIDAVGRSEKEAEITRAIIALSHSLGMMAVAEGVETEDQWQRLNELACDQVQGFYVARPMTAEAIGEHLGRQGTAGLSIWSR